MESQNRRKDKILKPFVYLHKPHQENISLNRANLLNVCFKDKGWPTQLILWPNEFYGH